MNIKRTGMIKYKVFKQRDFKKIVKYFIKVEEDLKHEDTELHLRVEFVDGSSIRGSDTSILDETETKIVEVIHITLRNYILSTEMNTYMSTTSGFYEVESKNKDWVDAKFAQLEEILRVTPNQNYWIANFKIQLLISNFIATLLGVLLYIFVFRKLIDEETLNGDFSSFGVILASLFLGHLISHFPMERLYKLYPIIDFDLTSNHLNKNKKKRRVIFNLFIMIILPLIISYFSILLFS